MRAIPALLLLCSCATAQPAQTVKRGLTGGLTFTYEGPELIASPAQDLSAPLLLRLEPTGKGTYTARFIGSVEGDYDLRSLIVMRSGAKPDDLPPLPVKIVSNLPESFATDLYDAADLRVALASGYWVALISLAGIWLAIPIAVIARRMTRPKPVDVVPDEAPRPSLADQLRPIVVATSQRELTVAEQGRLELLLLHYWRERIAPDAPDMIDAIERLRSHSEAGELLRAVEAWLHAPDPSAHNPSRLDSLLRPYRQAPPIETSSLPPPRPAEVVP